MANTLNIPQSPPVDIKTGNWDPEWLQWIQSPSFLSIQTGNALGPSSGGTGTTGTPPSGSILVGNGTTYSISTSLPVAALPAFGGDATSSAGSATLTFATVNSTPGAYGSGTTVSTFTVNGKGLITAVANANITGSPGAFTAVGGFGCNSKTAQTSAAVGAAIAGSAGVVYTGTEQGLINSLLSLVNQLRAALVANGITV